MSSKHIDFGSLAAAAAVKTANAVSTVYLNTLEEKYRTLDGKAREIKRTGVVMETDEESLRVTDELREVSRKILSARYGPTEPYRVRFDLEFQPSMPDFDAAGPTGTFVAEMAPAALVPYSVLNFLEVARTTKTAGFHRNAKHVLQAFVRGTPVKSLAFQEYSPKFPHKKGTMGYCGRPSGPCFYVSTMDNTRNHGPGSQQNRNPHEADAAFGTVVEGFEDVVLGRVHKMPYKEFTNDASKFVKIVKMKILVPDERGGFKGWREPTTM